MAGLINRRDKEVSRRMKGWLLLALLSVAAIAQDHPMGSESQRYSVYEYVTCGVYFRMLIGALKIKANDLSSLEEVYMDQMNRAIRAGRHAAKDEWGEKDADEEFDLEWKTVYGEMSTEIDRNFTKIRRLKMKYADRCSQMGKNKDNQIKLSAAPAFSAYSYKPFQGLVSSKQ